MRAPDDMRELAEAVAPRRILSLRLKDGRLAVVVEAGGLDAGERAALEQQLRETLGARDDVTEVAVAMTVSRESGAPAPAATPAPAPAPAAPTAPAPRIIAVGSGKGGVGKSTLSANLAVALARMGRPLGLVDADIYGPSQPVLLGREDSKPEAEDKKLHPVDSGHGFSFLSMGQLAAPGTAIAWRGPMAGNALSQLIDAHWDQVAGGPAKDLIVDLPPGTGDIQLSMVQKHKPAGAVIVSTPQDLSLIDAARAIAFFDKAGVPIIGLVENMAGYVCPHCGEVSDPFGSGGAEAAARELNIPFLGRIPLDLSIRLASDAGTPPAAGDTVQGQAFMAIARRVALWLDERS